MNVRGLRVWSSSLLLLAGACGAKRLPPGTPPPEYEPRPVIPWDEAAIAREPKPAAPEAAGSDEPSDAGAAAAPDPSAAAADAGPGAFPEHSAE
jgi:hypothetical protein